MVFLRELSQELPAHTAKYHSKRCSGSGKTLRNHSSLGSVTFGNSSIMQQKLLSLHLSCLEWHLRRQISMPRGHVTAQFPANHVTACFCLTCVRKSNPCYSSEDKFLAEIEFDLMYSSSNGHCCSRTPRHVQICRQICSHLWKRPPKWGVHCKPQGQGVVVISRPIQVCTLTVFCLFYLLLPVLHLSPELRSTADQVFGW